MDDKISIAQTLQPKWKIWLEKDGVYVLGPGAYSLLSAIHESGSLTAAAKKIGMSYRYAWGVIKKIERKIGVKIVETFRGGSVGGGGAHVTTEGLEMMKLFAQVNKEFERAASKHG
ncbi:MAG: LysR family transcriptional regulator [Candidatus Thorarchaeota archaeon]|nr:LysR family transcriptional regulator [Candidatus Thorarchaeota archaeon]